LYDMVTSKPIAGATILLAKAKPGVGPEDAVSAATDADGHFELRAAPRGSFSVIASTDGYAPRALGYVELRGNTFKRFISQLAPSVELTGKAVDSAGKPVAGATVRADDVVGIDGRGYILPSTSQANTNDKGEFTLTGLPRGYVRLYYYAKDYAGLDVLKVHSVPEVDLTIRLTATGTVKGRVLDKAGKPAASGNVSIEPAGKGRNGVGSWGGGCNIAADGSFKFENVPPDEYVVRAQTTTSGQAQEKDRKTITVKAGETTEVEVTGR
jgi:hypothetical protein